MDPSPDEANDAGGALPPMALLATLQTATTVWEGVAERRAGRDPSAQEPASGARAYLRAATGELASLHMQLLMAKVQAERVLEENTAANPSAEKEDGEVRGAERPNGASSPSQLAATVRRFDLLMKLRRTDRLLHGTHQRLMSLYPEVSEELVEEARRCQRVLFRLRGAPSSTPPSDDAFGEGLGLFLQRLLSFTAWMEREL